MRGAPRSRFRQAARTAPVALLVAMMLAGCLGPEDTQGDPPRDTWEDWFKDVVWDTRGDYSRVLEPGPYNVLPAQRHRIEAHDGVMLDTAVWRPEVPDNVSVPVILDIGPYYGGSITAMNVGSREDQFFLQNLVTHGYAYGRVATRGSGTSEGCMEFFGPNEQQDVDTVLDYYGSREWSNGNIALYGASYDGTTPWIGASFGNEHLKTIVPVVGLTDVAGLMFRNGTSEFRGPIMHSYVYWVGYGLGYFDGGMTTHRFDHWAQQACEEFLVGTLEGPIAAATGDVNREYWQVRDWRQRVLDKYEGSVYLAHGLQDWNVEATMAFPFLRELEEKGLDVKIMLGQWGHDWPDRAARQESDSPVIAESVRWDWAELLKRWFDRELKGLDVEVGPTADVQDAFGAWRTEGTWPPLDLDWTPLHLGDGVLSWDTQPSGSSLGAHAGDLDLGATPVTEPYWRFETEEFLEDLRFAGLARLHATFTTTVPDANILARLEAVGDSGTMQVAWGVMNIRYHEGGTEAVDMLPGDTFVARLEMFPADVVIPAGHKLRLSVYPNIPSDAPDPLPRGPTPLELHWGDGQSVLKLPVIERDVGDGKYPGQP